MGALTRSSRVVPQVPVSAVVGYTRSETAELNTARVTYNPLNYPAHTPIDALHVIADTAVCFGEDKLETVMADDPTSTRDTMDIVEVH